MQFVLPYALVCIGLLLTTISIRSQSLTQQLGYPKDTKLLIIHADDLGVAHSENQATFDAFEKGMVKSASVMVPSPWFNEVVDWAKRNPGVDIGLHLALTAEWDFVKWGPVASTDQVSGLVNKHGYFYGSVRDVIENASVEQVEIELRAQIEKSIEAGLNPTHLDSHMGSLFNDKFFQVYAKLGREYQIPVMVSDNVFDMFYGERPTKFPDNMLLVDQVHMAFPQNYQNGMERFYTNTLRSLSPGVNVVLIHPAYDNDEMQGVARNHPNYGSDWRQQDFNFFTSEACRKILEEENITVITWKEIGKLLK